MAADTSNMETEGPDMIQAYHDEAYMYISQGLSYEEQNETTLACDMYKKGLEKIDVALNIRCDRPFCVGPKWDKARMLQQKMRKNMQSVRSQLEKLSLVYQNEIRLADNISELPPSYDEACEQNGFSFSRRASCPSTCNGSTNFKSLKSVNGKSAEEVFTIPDGVQLFFVSSDGVVTTPSSPTSLHVYKFSQVQALINETLPAAWLQVSNWTYPLVPGQSPILESGYGAFIFPDLASDQEGASVGLILPSTVNYDTRREFEAVLASLTQALVEDSTCESPAAPTKESFSDTLSRGLVTGAEYLSVGLVKGASVTGEYIHKGASKLKERLVPDETPKTIDPKVKEGLKVAKSATGTALQVSGFLVSKLGSLTIALGHKVAPIIREQGTKLLTHAFKNDSEQAKNTVDGVLKVAAGGVQGFSTVYMGLENAARILAYSLSTETVNVVGHKYGDEAGEVVGNALLSIGNLALTTRNVQTLGVKSVAKRTAKDAGKAVLKDYVDQYEKPASLENQP